jgi:hypothetical protein
MSEVLSVILEIVSGLVGFGAMCVLFRRRRKFSGQKLPWYGFRRLPNGDIDMDPDLVVLAGLITLAAGFAIWMTVKSWTFG